MGLRMRPASEGTHLWREPDSVLRLRSFAARVSSSLRLPARGLDVHGDEVEIVTIGRHDPCVGIRATPICEAMMALVLMDQAMRHRAQCGDVGDVSPRIPASAGSS